MIKREVGFKVKYNDWSGNEVIAKVVKNDGYIYTLDNGGKLKALPMYVIKEN